MSVSECWPRLCRTMHGRLDETESPVAGTGRLCGSELSDVCQSILNAEIRNGLVHGRDFAIDLQARTCSRNSSGLAAFIILFAAFQHRFTEPIVVKHLYGALHLYQSPPLWTQLQKLAIEWGIPLSTFTVTCRKGSIPIKSNLMLHQETWYSPSVREYSTAAKSHYSLPFWTTTIGEQRSWPPKTQCQSH